jgi:hypothetical protein
MYKALKILGWFFLAIIIIYLLLFSYGRLRGPTPEQERAVKLLKEQVDFDPKTNSQAYIWLMSYDVPVDQEVAITKRDIARYNALTDAKAIMDFKSEADGKYAELNMNPQGLESLCHEKSEKPCLAEVAEQRTTIKKTLADNAKALKRAERIRDYRSYYSDFKMHLVGPLPAFNSGQSLLKIHYADLYLDGKRFEAMDKMCRDLESWRSISGNSDFLLTAMVGQSYSRQRIHWLAEMLEQLPSAERVPESCSRALAPMAMEERDICRAMQGEHEILENFDVGFDVVPVDETFVQAINRHAMPLMFSNELTTRGLAPARAVACFDEAKQHAAQDLLYTSAKPLGYSCDVVERVANPMGCLIGEETIDPYATYRARRLDFGAQIEAGRTMLWLKQQNADAESVASYFDKRPTDMRMFEKRSKMIVEGKKAWIEIDLHDVPRFEGNKHWRLPLAVQSEN